MCFLRAVRSKAQVERGLIARIGDWKSSGGVKFSFLCSYFAVLVAASATS